MAETDLSFDAFDASVTAAAKRGLVKATIYAKVKVKELLSTAAPRKRVNGKGGVLYYRATTKATAGAPPRKLSGTLRQRQEMEIMNGGLRGVVGCNVIYARRLEEGNHPFYSVVAGNEQAEFERIILEEIAKGY